MLDIRTISKDPDDFARRIGRRGEVPNLPEVLELDLERRKLVGRSGELRQAKGEAQKKMSRADKKSPEFEAFRERMRTLSAEIKEVEDRHKVVEDALSNAALLLPNVPDSDVPDGKSEADNVTVRTWGEPPSFDFTPRPHWEVGEALGVLDFERASKITGARFVVYCGAGARLERSLINFMLDRHTGAHGYTEMLTPFLVSPESMLGTGQFPKFRDDAFELGRDPLVLVPTAEVPLVNLHRAEILDEGDLPIRYAAYTPCFRREAGSYGRDTRGLIRQHQFQKVELVQFTRPEESHAALEALTGHAEAILRELALPYRLVNLCAGDLGFAAARTYDLEVWLPGQSTYREISSCSNCTEFQARRAGIRYRAKDVKKPQFVHTLNGSGLAVGRTVVAILENYQRSDGTVEVPEALRPYMGGLEVIERCN